jgi:nucleoside-diphosphate-sugar epimerase
MSTHIVTGGTGFVGAALILEVLCRTDDDILCLVRAGQEDADTRLYKALRVASRAFGYNSQIMALVQQRCTVLEGDLTEVRCGCTPARSLGTIEHFWHSAASLKFEDQYEEEIYRTNVQGTDHVLALANMVRAQNFHYISTAYVAGKLEGIIPETLHEGHQLNNAYERSKLEAEKMVMSTTSLRTRIFRPGIVVGHTQTYGVSGSYSGFYGFIRKVISFQRLMKLMNVNYLTTEGLAIFGSSDIPLGLVPINMVVSQAVRIALASPSASLFHLVNTTPPSLGTVISIIFRELALKKPVFVPNKAELSGFNYQFSRTIDFYQEYFYQSKIFDRSTTNAVLGDPHSGDFPMDERILTEYVRWYLRTDDAGLAK